MADKTKIKIAIATRKMVMGGIEKSLIELCKKLLEKEYEVHLFLEEPGGELFNELPKKIIIHHIFENCNSSKLILEKSLKQINFKALYGWLYSNLDNRLGGDPVKGWEHTLLYVPRNNEKYDYAFAYGAPVSFSVVYVNERLNAKKKYIWIHNEINQLSLNIVKYKRIFSCYDKVVCVSNKARDLFMEYMPEYKNKLTVFYNITDRKYIMSQAQKFQYNDGFKGIKLLTTGRLCYQKGQDIIPSITRRLVENGYDIRWYCVGDGEKKDEIYQLIHKNRMEKRVILLGNQKNPYPFYRMADIYVQPSRNEGFGITISEAKMFGLPIITTDFAGADEQIIHNKTGFIVHFGEKKIYNAIITMSDKNIRKKMKMELYNDKRKCESKLDELFN